MHNWFKGVNISNIEPEHICKKDPVTQALNLISDTVLFDSPFAIGTVNKTRKFSMTREQALVLEEFELFEPINKSKGKNIIAMNSLFQIVSIKPNGNYRFNNRFNHFVGKD